MSQKIEKIAAEEAYGYRRAVQRYPCSLEGNYSLSSGLIYQLRCENISSQGAKIVTWRRLPDKAFLTFEFDTLNRGSFILKGKVCWSKRNQDCWYSGVSFNQRLPFEIRKFI